jgi:ribose/xylose/arabinose/galactoside ABC-type transport system permease subunit
VEPSKATVHAELTASAEAARGAQNRSRLLRAGGAIVLLLVVVFAINAFSGGSFLTAGNLTNVLRQITYNAILAIGQTFVIITAGIDLSVGSLIELTGVVMASFANAMHFDGPMLVVATLIVGVGVGCLAGLINALPVVTLNLPPFITTLAMMLMARGLAFKIAHGQPIPLNSSAFNSTGTGFVFTGLRASTGFPGIPIPVVWLAVMVVVFAILLTRTRFGRYVFAIGGNEEAARLAGINVKFVKAMVYVISGGCAAIASLLLMAKFASGSPNTGIGNELQSIAAVVVGGTSLAGGRGSVVTTFFGALLIGLLNNVMNLLNIESYTQDIVLGAVILIAVVFDELRKRYLTR